MSSERAELWAAIRLFDNGVNCYGGHDDCLTYIERCHAKTDKPYMRLVLLREHTAADEAREKAVAELIRDARAVVERWDTQYWKDQPHTAAFINALRKSAYSPALTPTPPSAGDRYGHLLGAHRDPDAAKEQSERGCVNLPQTVVEYREHTAADEARERAVDALESLCDECDKAVVDLQRAGMGMSAQSLGMTASAARKILDSALTPTPPSAGDRQELVGGLAKVLSDQDTANRIVAAVTSPPPSAETDRMPVGTVWRANGLSTHRLTESGYQWRGESGWRSTAEDLTSGLARSVLAGCLTVHPPEATAPARESAERLDAYGLAFDAVASVGHPAQVDNNGWFRAAFAKAITADRAASDAEWMAKIDRCRTDWNKRVIDQKNTIASQAAELERLRGENEEACKRIAEACKRIAKLIRERAQMHEFQGGMVRDGKAQAETIAALESKLAALEAGKGGGVDPKLLETARTIIPMISEPRHFDNIEDWAECVFDAARALHAALREEGGR